MSDNKKWICVVCRHEVPNPRKKEIFAIGQCDHLVCYECSIRMRVLCKQNECAICRQPMAKVIYTLIKTQKFEDYDLSKCVHHNEEFGIYFEDAICVDVYGRLLEHPCKKCKTRAPFKNLHDLQTHLRKEHELYMCDLCVQNLKVFTHERKYYNRRELARHRKTGDPDETSHRGHPLCKFCDIRYNDDDELQAHLRLEHFYCHFCDPSGLSHFYNDYDALRDHFRNDHFLCEECDNQQERFTCAFRSEIDFQAHIASIHSQGLSKTDLKKARTLSLDLFVRPRAGPSAAPSQPYSRKKNQRAQQTIDETDSEVVTEAPTVPSAPIPRPEDFPRLLGQPNDSSNAMNERSSNAFSVRVSRNPSSITSNEHDFPALPLSNTLEKRESFPLKQKTTEGRVTSQTLALKISKQKAAKPSRASIDHPHADGVEHSKPNLAFLKVQPKPAPIKPLINSNNEFPALPIKSKTKKNVNTINYALLTNQTQRAMNNGNSINTKSDSTKDHIDSNKKKITKGSATTNTIVAPPNLLEEFPVLDQPQRKINAPPGLITNKVMVPKSTSVAPPPGLSYAETSTVHCPKKSISLSSVAREMIGPSNGDTIQENEYFYLNPPEFNQRNHSLVTEIGDILDDSKFDKFKSYSKQFRQNSLIADDYYKKCIELLGKTNFAKIFSELIVLLPDIKKQNELLKAHQSYLKASKGAIPKKSGSFNILMEHNDFVNCPMCQQVMNTNDGPQHMVLH